MHQLVRRRRLLRFGGAGAVRLLPGLLPDERAQIGRELAREAGDTVRGAWMKPPSWILDATGDG
jgi:hypothetical protein